jgi:hypothetical protein
VQLPDARVEIGGEVRDARCSAERARRDYHVVRRDPLAVGDHDVPARAGLDALYPDPGSHREAEPGGVSLEVICDLVLERVGPR